MRVVFTKDDLCAMSKNRSIEKVDVMDFVIHGDRQILHDADVIVYFDGEKIKVLKDRTGDHTNVEKTYSKFQKGDFINAIIPING
jgi:hypothetical protein